MNENNTIKKMVSGILRGRNNASFDRHIMHPEREWFVVVFIGVGLFGVGIAWNVSTHFLLKNHLRQIQLRFRQANQKKERCQEKRCWLFRDGVLGHESLSIFVRLRLQIY